VAWRLSQPSHSQANQIWPLLGGSNTTGIWLGGLVRDAAIVALVWIVLFVAGRGVVAVRGGTSLFLGCLGGVMLTFGGVYVAIIPLQFGWGMLALSFYSFTELSLGLIAGLLTGLITAALAVLVYKTAASGEQSPS
jgi:hypothetical protein